MKANRIVAAMAAVSVGLGASATLSAVERVDLGDGYGKLWNAKLNAEIDARIERCRKADFAAEGFPAGAEVTVEQVSSAFKIGCGMLNFGQTGDDAYEAEYRRMFGKDGLFDAATIPFYWKHMEPVQGQIRYTAGPEDHPEFWKKFLKGRTIVRWDDPDCPNAWRRPSPDGPVAFCEANGIAMHGHVIIYPHYHPDWVKATPTKEDQQKVFDRRIYDIATYYRGRIPQWDVVNESVNRSCTVDNPNDDVCWGNPSLLVPWDYTFKAYRLAAELFPADVRLCINDSWREIYPPFIRQLKRRGAKIDVVGIQMHIFSEEEGLTVAKGEGYANGTFWDPAKHIEMFRKLDTCHAPIHVSEVTIPALHKYLPADKADELQARMLRDYYRLWFSWPSVCRITYWNPIDNFGMEIMYSGFLTRDFRKKPVYHTLRKLVHEEWRTHAKVTADAKGAIAFRGFKGGYRLSWKNAAGETESREVTVR